MDDQKISSFDDERAPGDLIPADPSEAHIIFAVVPVMVLVGLLTASVKWFGAGAGEGMLQVSLLVATATCCALARLVGVSWTTLEDSLVSGVSLAVKPILILFSVSVLIGAWMFCGTVPALVLAGLKFIDPNWLLPGALCLSAMVSLTTGSSWTTIGTVGVALMAIAQINGMPLPIMAGAIVSGAFFGDKMSPLSDTTNLAPAVVGVNLYKHIAHMLWTAVPAFLIAFVFFTVSSLSIDSQASSVDSIRELEAIFTNHYRFGWPVFVPFLVPLILAIRGMQPLPALAVGIASAFIVAGIYQPGDSLAVANLDEGASTFSAFGEKLFLVSTTGFSINTGAPQVDAILSRGGMRSMLDTIWLVIAAMCFGSVMESSGFLRRIIREVKKVARTRGMLILSTVMSCIGVNIIVAEQYMAIVLPGRLFRTEYEEYGLRPENLSRTIEDAGTVVSPLVPWNTCGAFVAATLAVPTVDYFLFCLVSLVTPLLAIAFGFLGFGLGGPKSRSLTT